MENSEGPEIPGEKKARKSYSIQYKKKILEDCITKGNVYQVATQNNLNYQMVLKWRKAADDLDEMPETKKRLVGGGRKPIIGELEDSIFDWFCERRANNLKNMLTILLKILKISILLLRRLTTGCSIL